jgi:serine/threonine-protein kinase
MADSGEPAPQGRCCRHGERAVETISFPAISTGVYGYPPNEAAKIAMREVKQHLEREDTPVRTVIFVLYGKAALDVYERTLSSNLS